MKNKADLLQAAQQLAASTLHTLTETIDIEDAKREAFKNTGLAKSHWPEWSREFDSARQAYLQRVKQPVTLATPAAPAPETTAAPAPAKAD